ncbi:MAG TPA: hypothetical protein VNY84_03535, partial [Acidimicrobiales bacterium]|nr:hypothetical protein [Acidimicrobiales bacterium]
VDHDVTGLLVAPGNVAEMARSIGDLLSDAPRRARMSEEARHQARQRFARERMVAEYHGWCREIVARRSLAPT